MGADADRLSSPRKRSARPILRSTRRWQPSQTARLMCFSDLQPHIKSVHAGALQGRRSRLEAVALLASSCANTQEVMEPAGADLSRGVLALGSVKPWDADPKNDPAMADYNRFMKERLPNVDPSNLTTIYAYMITQTLVDVLQRCGDDLSPRAHHGHRDEHEGCHRADDVARHRTQHEPDRLPPCEDGLYVRIQRKRMDDRQGGFIGTFCPTERTDGHVGTTPMSQNAIPMPSHPFWLSGKTALVTGGGSGLGARIVHTLAASGASVYCVDVTRPQHRTSREPSSLKVGTRNRSLAMSRLRKVSRGWRRVSRVSP